MKTPITLETKLKKGDIITRGDYNNMVLGVLDELCFVSNSWGEGHSERIIQEIQQEGGYFYTIESLARQGYELLTPDWSPDELKKGDEYWYVTNELYVEQGNWYDTMEDRFYKKLNLIFQTKEQAEAKLKEIMSK
mgnify:CR=1 FL=1